MFVKNKSKEHNDVDNDNGPSKRLKLDNSVDIMLNLSFLSSAFQINKKLLKDKLIRINKNILQN